MKTSKLMTGLCVSGFILGAAVPAYGATTQDFSANISRTVEGVTVDGHLLKPKKQGGVIQEVVKTRSGNYANVSSSAEVVGDPFPELTLAATSKGVQLSWGAVEEAKKYQVFRNGTLLKETNKLEWVDKKAKLGAVANYTIETVTSKEPKPQGGRFEAVPLVEGTTASPGESAPEEVARKTSEFAVVVARSISVPTTTSASSALSAKKADISLAVTSRQTAGTTSSSAQAVAAAPGWAQTGPTSVMRHTTFIPDKWVNSFGCEVSNGVRYLNGNNRGYSITSESYKTRMNVYFYWDKNAIGLGANVKPTIAVDANYREVSRKTASNAGMKATRWYPHYPGYTHFWVTIKHNAVDPYCANTAAPISYNWNARVDESGAYAIAGQHDFAPSHEIYYGRHWAGDAAAGWQNVHQAPQYSLFCLYSANPFCPQIRIQNGIGDPNN